eukprot:CAMPEP_0170306408 /NCGR_PEP_ID=MMETSP0116_2-20130129/53593_1 /TAXON_ID=400756 /ORGANISM="Durinskia baltica, Strain CSIRO CS-38" /LENGTH=59 /DNA_ID=CAMNT_0010558489 /DNA_START=38 /DNA_END=213 /DNA_ORIENTATION=-
MPGGSQPSPISALRPIAAALIIASGTSNARPRSRTMALKLSRPRLLSFGVQCTVELMAA